MTQTLLLVTASVLLCALLLLCVLFSQRPGAALAGHFFSGGKPPGGGRGPEAQAAPRGTPQAPSPKASAAAPTEPSQVGLADYPDRPLEDAPRKPVTPAFVVEHRTALAGREVTVRGRVVTVAAVPSGSALPRIFLAETAEPGRDKNYDLMVLLGEEDEGRHAVGDEVEIKGTVESSKVAVLLRKSY